MRPSLSHDFASVRVGIKSRTLRPTSTRREVHGLISSSLRWRKFAARSAIPGGGRECGEQFPAHCGVPTIGTSVGMEWLCAGKLRVQRGLLSNEEQSLQGSITLGQTWSRPKAQQIAPRSQSAAEWWPCKGTNGQTRSGLGPALSDAPLELHRVSCIFSWYALRRALVEAHRMEICSSGTAPSTRKRRAWPGVECGMCAALASAGRTAFQLAPTSSLEQFSEARQGQGRPAGFSSWTGS